MIVLLLYALALTAVMAGTVLQQMEKKGSLGINWRKALIALTAVEEDISPQPPRGDVVSSDDQEKPEDRPRPI